MSADDLLFHLRSVLQKVQREREQQKALDAANLEYVSNPSRSTAVHTALRGKVRQARGALRHAKRNTTIAIKLAEEVAYPEPPKLVTEQERVA